MFLVVYDLPSYDINSVLVGAPDVFTAFSALQKQSDMALLLGLVCVCACVCVCVCVRAFVRACAGILYLTILCCNLH